MDGGMDGWIFVLLATMGFNLQPERGDSSPEKHHSFTLYHLPPGRSATKRDMLFHILNGGKANPKRSSYPF